MRPRHVSCCLQPPYNLRMLRFAVWSTAAALVAGVCCDTTCHGLGNVCSSSSCSLGFGSCYCSGTCSGSIFNTCKGSNVCLPSGGCCISTCQSSGQYVQPGSYCGTTGSEFCVCGGQPPPSPSPTYIPPSASPTRVPASATPTRTATPSQASSPSATSTRASTPSYVRCPWTPGYALCRGDPTKCCPVDAQCCGSDNSCYQYTCGNVCSTAPCDCVDIPSMCTSQQVCCSGSGACAASTAECPANTAGEAGGSQKVTATMIIILVTIAAVTICAIGGCVAVVRYRRARQSTHSGTPASGQECEMRVVNPVGDWATRRGRPPALGPVDAEAVPPAAPL